MESTPTNILLSNSVPYITSRTATQICFPSLVTLHLFMQRDSVSRAGGKKTKPQADTLSSQKLRSSQVLKSIAQEPQNHKNEAKLNMQTGVNQVTNSRYATQKADSSLPLRSRIAQGRTACLSGRRLESWLLRGLVRSCWVSVVSLEDVYCFVGCWAVKVWAGSAFRC